MRRRVLIAGLLVIGVVVVIVLLVSRTPDARRDPEASARGVDAAEDASARLVGRDGVSGGQTDPTADRPPSHGSPRAKDQENETEKSGSIPITVNVVDERGKPIKDVRIIEHMPGWLPGLRWLGKSDSEGVAHVLVREGRFHVRVCHGQQWHSSEALALPSEEESFTFHVVETIEIKVTVLGPTGAPCTDVEATAKYLDQYRLVEGSGSRSVPDISNWLLPPTDAKGQTSFRVPPWVTMMRIRAGVDGVRTSARVDPRQQSDVLLQARRLLSIRGVIVREDGEEVFFAGVQALPLDGGEVVDLIHEEGGFCVDVSAPGRYLLVARPQEPFRAACPDPIEVEAPAEGLRFALSDGLRLRGLVEGEDVGGFQVRWVRRRGPDRRLRVEWKTEVDAEGSFGMDGLTDGDTTIYVSKQGDQRYGLVEPVRLTDQDLNISLREGLPLGGRVAGYGRTYGFDLELGLVWRGPTVWVQVQDDGAFQFTGLPPGQYALTWRLGDEEEMLDRRVEPGGPEIEVVLPDRALDGGRLPRR